MAAVLVLAPPSTSRVSPPRTCDTGGSGVDDLSEPDDALSFTLDDDDDFSTLGDLLPAYPLASMMKGTTSRRPSV